MKSFLEMLGVAVFIILAILLLTISVGYLVVETESKRCEKLAGIEKAVKHERVSPYCVITHSNGEIEKLYIGG